MDEGPVKTAQKVMDFLSEIKLPPHLICIVTDNKVTFEREWSDKYQGMINRVICGNIEYEVVHGPEDTMEDFISGLNRYLNEVGK